MRSPNRNWENLGKGILLPVLALLAYLPVLSCGYVWDDNMYVLMDPSFRGLSGLYRIWFEPGARAQFYPIVYSGFWLEYQIWGLHPLGYHLVNVCLHGLNSALLWVVLKRLQVTGAWWCAAVFALHPVHVESVAWITELKNVLSCFFYLSAILAFFRFDPPLSGAEPERPHFRWGWYGFSLWLYLCALLSKTVACSLPVALALIYGWRRSKLERRFILALSPFFFLGLFLGLLTVWMEREFVGAEGVEWRLSFVERGLIAGRALWFYAGKLLVPLNLTFIYPRWEVDDRVWSQYLFPCAALGVLVALWALRGKIGRGPFIAILFFVAALFPALGFFDVYPMRFSYVADHFQYLATIGPIVLGVQLAIRVSDRLSSIGTHWKKGLGFAYLVLLATLAWTRVDAYRDEEALWRDTLEKNPAAWIAHLNLGILLAEQGKYDEAVQGYEEALKYKPDCAEAFNQIALARKEQGRVAEAEDFFERAIDLDPGDARFHHNFANLLAGAGRTSEAEDQYKEALKRNPKFVDSSVNLADLVAASGEFRRAISYLTEATLVAPYNALPFNNIGNLVALQGNHDGAVEYFEKAVRLDPGFAAAYFNLGQSLGSIGHNVDALAAYRNAVRLNPDWPEPAVNLAIMLATNKTAQEDELSEAVLLAETACEATAYENPSMLAALAVVYSKAGRLEESEKLVEESLSRAQETGGDDARKSLEKRLLGLGLRAPE